MRGFVSIYLLFFTSLGLTAQQIISGSIVDEAGSPLIGANIYLKGTYDGATSDVNGTFHFETFERGKQLLLASFVGFVTKELEVLVEESLHLELRMKTAFNSMEAVSISAGAFEASDEKKVVILRSLDIATTAGATADITGALNTLPGTQTVGESGRLFVRGGTADETRIFIDGAEAANYYGASTGNLPTRSRFSPFLFKGTFFSTGGYSAEYGQALSSVLILNTRDPEPLNQIDISLMSVGLEAGITRSTEDESFHTRLGYTNLNPYNKLIDQRVRWINGSTTLDGVLSYKKRFKTGVRLKVLTMGNVSDFSLQEKTSFNPKGYNEIAVANKNLFGTATVEFPIGETDYLYLGTSGNLEKNRVVYNEVWSDEPANTQHYKAKYVHEISPKSVLSLGSEMFVDQYDATFTDSIGNVTSGFNNGTLAVYGELDQYLSEDLVFRAGARTTRVSILDEWSLSPRLSMAYQLSELEQFSFATGIFYQRPSFDYLRIAEGLKQERAVHYILNYQRMNAGKVFRVESFYKVYDRLVTYDHLFDPTGFDNQGDGVAYGVDFFWRDRGGIKNIDYWISYSWMNSERLYRDFPSRATPGFSSAHNLSLVVKKWFQAIRTQMGATYSFTSGRPYENPNLVGFNESITKAYHDLSFNAAYLPTPSIILYVSATNLLGLDQVFGYTYSQDPNESGNYPSEAIRLPARRFLFIGCFITIGAFNNQLENL